MKAEDRYLKFVLWSEEDKLYVGYCPDLFPWGGVCHSKDEGKAYGTLAELVREEVADLTKADKTLPAPITRPMRELAIASIEAVAA